MPRKTYEDIERDRRAAIIARKQLIPKCRCHYCDYEVPKLALWCATECAKLYEEEKRQVFTP